MQLIDDNKVPLTDEENEKIIQLSYKHFHSGADNKEAKEAKEAAPAGKEAATEATSKAPKAPAAKKQSTPAEQPMEVDSKETTEAPPQK